MFVYDQYSDLNVSNANIYLIISLLLNSDSVPHSMLQSNNVNAREQAGWWKKTE